MTNKEAKEILGDVQAYLASRASLANESIAGHSFIDICNAIHALKVQLCEDVGELSDGYHTFNQLYHQRAVLFACIVKQNKNKAWKSFKHSDGKYCFDSDGEWFIVGVDTPQGSYTYHYSKEYWDMFDCQELEFGKEWDGHTEEDVTRLLSLEQQPSEKDIRREREQAYMLGYEDASKKFRTPPSEDFVSRDSLNDAISELTYWHFEDGQLVVGGGGIKSETVYKVDDVVRIPDIVPSVTPQRPKGKWIEIEIDAGEFIYRCTKCGMRVINPYKYCPMCGSYNGGGEE